MRLKNVGAAGNSAGTGLRQRGEWRGSHLRQVGFRLMAATAGAAALGVGATVAAGAGALATALIPVELAAHEAFAKTLNFITNGRKYRRSWRKELDSPARRVRITAFGWNSNLHRVGLRQLLRQQ